MASLTIFTPTYNRAYTLERLYKSLLAQTNKNFEWVIVDDGSKDNTQSLVNKWMSEAKIPIKYLHQMNRGKHIAHNVGVENAKGELFTCLDSDDWFYNDAVENILKLYEELPKKNLAGIIGIDTYENKKIIGNQFPSKVKYSNWKELIFKHKLQGDKAIFFVTSLIKRYPFPDNEDKHMPPSYQLYMLNPNFKFALTNKAIKFVEYLPDGITFNIRKKYQLAPNNYCQYRLLMMKIAPNIRFKLKNAVHYNVSRKYIKENLKNSKTGLSNKITIALTKPIGLIIWYWIEKKK